MRDPSTWTRAEWDNYERLFTMRDEAVRDYYQRPDKYDPVIVAARQARLEQYIKDLLYGEIWE